MVPRGIRNNNPGNLDRTGDRWVGLAEPHEMTKDQLAETRFCVFVEPKFGIRALCKVLLSYQSKHGLRSIRKMISRWAPPVENDTGAYVDQVAKAVGVDADRPIELLMEREKFKSLVKAIIQHENGQMPYDDITLETGIRLACGE